MKRHSFKILFVLCGAVFLLFLFSPDLVQRSAHESVLFCASVLIPSLFPGFVLADLLISLSVGCGKQGGIFSKLFRLPSSMTQCWVMGLLAGFPTAADCAVRSVLSGRSSKKQAERCLSFTNNPGIVFVVCAVGSGLFGSFAVGFYLWSLQTVSALLVGILFAEIDGEQPEPSPVVASSVSLKQVFPKSVVSSVSSVLNICGFVIFFRTLIDVITCAIPLEPLQALFAGLLEMTCGISQLGAFGPLSAVAVSAMLGWSGFSVHFQILNVTTPVDLSLRYYFPGKLLQTIFSAGLAALSYPVFFDYGVPHIPLLMFCMITFVIFVIALRLRREYLWKTKSLPMKKIG